ncbi:LOW QUALITY PROTEIN: armadillo-like helical domain containing protein 1 [Sylvia borin]
MLQDAKVEEIMTFIKEQEAIAIMVFLQEWDSAHKVAQSCILNSFIKAFPEPELELEFQGASLFLAHLTVGLRMLHLFPWTAGGAVCHRYLTEFLEIGGVLILLEILELNHLKEENIRESVKLLLLTGHTGREHKEPICESYGTQHINLCLILIQYSVGVHGSMYAAPSAAGADTSLPLSGLRIRVRRRGSGLLLRARAMRGGAACRRFGLREKRQLGTCPAVPGSPAPPRGIGVVSAAARAQHRAWGP